MPIEMRSDKLTKNFDLSEFECNDLSWMPDHVYKNVKRAANNLQKLRDIYKRPIKITSAYRSKKYNKKIGGVSNSTHTLGLAVDIQIKNADTRSVYNHILTLIEDGLLLEGGVGLYDSFVHYDIRGTKARWDNSKNI
tara:strand:- start:1314 stop:1724 length:411 start_codon:yes stop_codon:yes gene_type:complete